MGRELVDLRKKTAKQLQIQTLGAQLITRPREIHRRVAQLEPSLGGCDLPENQAAE